MKFNMFYARLRHTKIYYLFSKLKYEKYLKNEFKKIEFDNKELTELNNISKLKVNYFFDTDKSDTSKLESLNIVLSHDLKLCLEDFRSYNYNKSLVNINQILKENKILKQLNIFKENNEFIDKKNDLFNNLKQNKNELLQALVYIKLQTNILAESYLLDEALILNLLEKNLLEYLINKLESDIIDQTNNILLFIKKRRYENKLDYNFFTFPMNNGYSNLFNSIYRFSKVAYLIKDDEMSAKVEYYLMRISLSINFYRNASVHVNRILNIINRSNLNKFTYEERLFKDFGLQINGFLNSFNDGHKDDNKVYFSYYRKRLFKVLESFLKNNEIANNYVNKSCLTLPTKYYLAKDLASNLNDLDCVTQNCSFEINKDTNNIEIAHKVSILRAQGILLDLDFKLFKVNEMYKRIFTIIKEYEETRLYLNYLRNSFIESYELDSLLNKSSLTINPIISISNKFPIDQTEIISKISKYISAEYVGNNHLSKLTYEMMFWSFFSLRSPKYMNFSLKQLTLVSLNKLQSIQTSLKLLTNNDNLNLKPIDFKEYPYNLNNKKNTKIVNINSEALILCLQRIALSCEEKSLGDVFFNYKNFLAIHREFFGDVDTEILNELKFLLYGSPYSIVLKDSITKKNIKLI